MKWRREFRTRAPGISLYVGSFQAFPGIHASVVDLATCVQSPEVTWKFKQGFS